METYRSGHNGTDSKSVVPHGTVGSNPTVSASEKSSKQAGLLDFSFCPKIHCFCFLVQFFPRFWKEQFCLYSPSFFSPKAHLLSKFPVSGNDIPSTIACAELTFDV